MWESRTKALGLRARIHPSRAHLDLGGRGSAWQSVRLIRVGIRRRAGGPTPCRVAGTGRRITLNEGQHRRATLSPCVNRRTPSEHGVQVLPCRRTPDRRSRLAVSRLRMPCAGFDATIRSVNTSTRPFGEISMTGSGFDLSASRHMGGAVSQGASALGIRMARVGGGYLMRTMTALALGALVVLTAGCRTTPVGARTYQSGAQRYATSTGAQKPPPMVCNPDTGLCTQGSTVVRRPTTTTTYRPAQATYRPAQVAPVQAMPPQPRYVPPAPRLASQEVLQGRNGNSRVRYVSRDNSVRTGYASPVPRCAPVPAPAIEPCAAPPRSTPCTPVPCVPCKPCTPCAPDPCQPCSADDIWQSTAPCAPAPVSRCSGGT